MARPSAEKPASGGPPSASVKPAPTTETFDLRTLAEGILARTIRPRIADTCRLAEAVLAGGRKPSKKKKKKKKKGAKKAERKLSKIPGQKTAK